MTEHSSLGDIDIWQDEAMAGGGWILVALCACGDFYTCTDETRSQAWQQLQLKISYHARA